MNRRYYYFQRQWAVPGRGGGWQWRLCAGRARRAEAVLAERKPRSGALSVAVSAPCKLPRIRSRHGVWREAARGETAAAASEARSAAPARYARTPPCTFAMCAPSQLALRLAWFAVRQNAWPGRSAALLLHPAVAASVLSAIVRGRTPPGTACPSVLRQQGG